MNFFYNKIIILLVFGLLLAVFVFADPLFPYNIKGRVFNSDGSGVENGIPVKINDTTNNSIFLTYVSAPSVPQLKGSYSTKIMGSENDNITVIAWDTTNYGINYSILNKNTVEVNMILNSTRPGETNVTLLYLANNSFVNISNITQISARIAAIGGQDSADCYVILNISNTAILNISSEESYNHTIAYIGLGNYVITNWSVVPSRDGRINLSVESHCSSDGDNFDGLNRFSVYNINLSDANAPIINLIYPQTNLTVQYRNNPIIFNYNVTDFSNIANCSLIINGTINVTNTTISKNITQNFSKSLEPGYYNWSIRCIDNSSLKNTGLSNTYYINVTPNYAPNITRIVIQNPTDLNPGGTFLVNCNVTIIDNDNSSDIVNINSTFYHSSSYQDSADDNNYHYTNSSCSITGSSQFERNYSCGFSVYYYADSGNWVCNITAVDHVDLSDSSNISTSINELVAIDTSPSIIDFGNITAGNTSLEDINLTLTNFGNVNLTIKLKGFAVNEGDNLSMNCSNGNISIDLERYSILYGQDYSMMVNLTSSYLAIEDFSLPQRDDDINYKSDRNITYWKINLPYGIRGSCNGSINLLADIMT